MRKYRLPLIVLIMALSLSLFGCGAKVNTDQLAYRTYGINCLSSGQYEDAVTAFQAALDCSNHIGDIEIDLCLYKAKAQALAGDTEGALETYTALLAVKKLPEAYLQRGNLYLATGQKDSALADYNAAADKAGKDYELYLSVYDSLTAYGDDAEALEFLTEAGKFSGKSAEDSYYKGRIALLTGDYDTAKTDLETAADGGIDKANFYLGKVYSALGDSVTAMSYYNAYTSSENASAEDFRDIGLAELEAGNYTEAITLLETARSLEETPDATLLPALATAYESILDFDNAYSALEEYCEAYPDDTQAAHELTFLETRRSDATAASSDGESTDESSGSSEDGTDESSDGSSAESTDESADSAAED